MQERTVELPHFIHRTVRARIPTSEGEFWLYHYRNQRDDKEHLAIVMGDVAGQDDILVRVHSECFTGDVIGSRRCDCGEQLHLAMAQIAEEGRGAILYLRQEGRGIGLEEKLKAYNLQDEGYDTVEANLLLGHQADERQYWAAAGIVADLEIRSIRLLTNNPDKLEKLGTEGISITGTVRLLAPVHADNFHYLNTKIEKMRHMLALPPALPPILPPIHTNGHADHADYAVNGAGKTNGIVQTNGTAHSNKPEINTPEISIEQYEGQLSRLKERIAKHQGDLPFVTVTWAQSIDGSLASKTGEPLRLSSDGAMRMTHRLRTLHDAILVGVGTVLADNPRLTTRLVEGPSPRPVILDSSLRTPTTSALFNHPKRPLFATIQPDPQIVAEIQQRGGEVIHLPADPSGRVDLIALLAQLARFGIRSVMVEGGTQILGSFIAQQLSDAAVITIATRLVGGIGVAAANIQMSELAHFDYTQIEGDLIMWGKFQ